MKWKLIDEWEQINKEPWKQADTWEKEIDVNEYCSDKKSYEKALVKKIIKILDLKSKVYNHMDLKGALITIFNNSLYSTLGKNLKYKKDILKLIENLYESEIKYIMENIKWTLFDSFISEFKKGNNILRDEILVEEIIR